MSRADTPARTYRRRRLLLMAAIVLIINIGTAAAIQVEKTATSASLSVRPATPAGAPLSSSTPPASALSSPPPASAVHFNFQDGTTEGWMSFWGPVSVASSTAHAFTGAHSLAITTQGGYSAVGANVVGVAAGTSVTYHLFSPAGGVPVMPFVTDTSWTNHFADHATLAQGWNTITWTVPQVSVSRIGLEVNRWSGTLFLGTVTWGGGVPSETPAPGPTAAPAPASAPGATPTSAPPATQGPSGPVTLTGDQVAGLPGGRYKLQANEYNSRAPMTLTSDGHPGFTVTTSGISLGVGGAPGAYPSVFRGCQWGDCTPDSGLPIQVSSMETNTSQVRLSYSTRVSAGGDWDDAFDIFYTPCDDHDVSQSGCTQSTQPDREMMIWLSHYGPAMPGGKPTEVTIDGINFNLWWDGHHTMWYVISSPSLTNPQVQNLDLGNFIKDAVNRGFIPSPSWYLMDIEAGFEIWQGGQGFQANSVSICTPAGC